MSSETKGAASQRVGVSVTRKPVSKTRCGVTGEFLITVYDKDGNLKAETNALNGIVDVGVDQLWGEVLTNTIVNVPTWFMGLVDGPFVQADGDTKIGRAHV